MWSRKLSFKVQLVNASTCEHDHNGGWPEVCMEAQLPSQLFLPTRLSFGGEESVDMGRQTDFLNSSSRRRM
jgi:hypothetical protein